MIPDEKGGGKPLDRPRLRHYPLSVLATVYITSSQLSFPFRKEGRAIEATERSLHRRRRQDALLRLIEAKPLLTDEELAVSLEASVSTVRLDRALLGVPELRERMRSMAEAARSRLRSLKAEEVVGELLELETDRWALSVLVSGKEMAFRHTRLVWDHYIYAQATTLAIATIGSEFVVLGAARVRYKRPAFVGERLVARAKVGVHKGNKYAVSVRTKVQDREIFLGRFIVVALPEEEATGGVPCAGC